MFAPKNRGLASYFRRAPKAAEVVASAENPCLGCGQETAIGSAFYSDRREANRSDGVRVFLCSDCQAAAHRARKGAPLSEEDLQTIANNGFMIGAGFIGGGSGGGGGF